MSSPAEDGSAQPRAVLALARRVAAQELDTARRHASEAESAHSRALHSEQLAAAAAADVQRESSAALSEVAP